VGGVSVTLVPATEISAPVAAPAYSDICSECGFVLLFVRVASVATGD
jgi:hypothetical protein